MSLHGIFTSAQLVIGTEVEMEHTKDRRLAQKIATDHLTEDPLYYTKLDKAGLIDEPKAKEMINRNADIK